MQIFLNYTLCIVIRIRQSEREIIIMVAFARYCELILEMGLYPLS